MREFYSLLNKAGSDRFAKWADHRKQIGVLFTEVVSLLENKDSIAVFGAGNCHDLDFHYLVENFNKVYLIDIDLEAVANGVDAQNLSSNNRIEIIQEDLACMKDFHKEFELLLQNNVKIKKIQDYLRRLDLSNQELICKYKDKFDVSCTAAIHTQLFYNEALSILSKYTHQYERKEIAKIIEELVYIRDIVIRNFNELVYTSIKTNGYVISWIDTIEINSENRNVVMENLKHLQVQKNKINYINTLLNTFGMASGIKGFKTLANMFQFIKGRSLYKYWIWDFDKDVSYFVIGVYMPKC